MKEKGIVFGKGFLGTRISKYFGFESVGREHNPVDYLSLEKFLSRTNPAFVINAVGATGRPNIDWCENNKSETLESNVLAAANLGHACLKLGIHFTHLGSGCIYQGDNQGKGFSEKDIPNFYGPQFYAITKILAEKALAGTNALILRIRMPIDNSPNERNLIDKLLKYPRVIDEPNSMTTVPDMLPILGRLIQNKVTGIYNFVNPGLISAANIMDMYNEIIDSKHQFNIMSLSGLNSITLGKRSNCHLNTDKLANMGPGYGMPEIHKAVRKCLLEYKKNVSGGKK